MLSMQAANDNHYTVLDQLCGWALLSIRLLVRSYVRPSVIVIVEKRSPLARALTRVLSYHRLV